ncbi:hypothetical protein L799_01880 [Enterobacter roggenkampii EC_38VIM1]|nr:hypothetical protein L799_01880 [Enterobacter roggenkampii EC_38VIM1]
MLIWDLLLRVIFNQHKMLIDTVFLPYQKREIAKKKFLPQHAF